MSGAFGISRQPAVTAQVMPAEQQETDRMGAALPLQHGSPGNCRNVYQHVAIN